MVTDHTVRSQLRGHPHTELRGTMDTLVCAHHFTQEDTDTLKDKVSPPQEDTYSGAAAAALGPQNAARGAQHGTPL